MGRARRIAMKDSREMVLIMWGVNPLYIKRHIIEGEVDIGMDTVGVVTSAEILMAGMKYGAMSMIGNLCIAVGLRIRRRRQTIRKKG